MAWRQRSKSSQPDHLTTTWSISLPDTFMYIMLQVNKKKTGTTNHRSLHGAAAAANKHMRCYYINSIYHHHYYWWIIKLRSICLIGYWNYFFNWPGPSLCGQTKKSVHSKSLELSSCQLSTHCHVYTFDDDDNCCNITDHD